MKYRKKPVVIEAMLWDGVEYRPIEDWVGDSTAVLRIDGDLIIHTLEGGAMRAPAGDWIIRGVAGEFYPCKPEIFAATYESVDDPGSTT